MDNQARDLERAASSGDPEAGVRLAHLGARAGNTHYIDKGLHSALPMLGYDELRKLQHAVGKAISKKVEEARETDPKSFGTTKAIELNLSELGKVSLGEFVATVEDFVERARHDPQSLKDSSLLHRTQSGYNRKTASACVSRAEEVFSEYNGDFIVGANGALRIYALKRDLSPEEKELRKQALQRKKLEEELRAHEERKAKLVKQLEKQQRSESRLKARLQKMEPKDGQET